MLDIKLPLHKWWIKKPQGWSNDSRHDKKSKINISKEEMQNYEEDLAISLDTQRLEEAPAYNKVDIETLP